MALVERVAQGAAAAPGMTEADNRSAGDCDGRAARQPCVSPPHLRCDRAHKSNVATTGIGGSIWRCILQCRMQPPYPVPRIPHLWPGDDPQRAGSKYLFRHVLRESESTLPGPDDSRPRGRESWGGAVAGPRALDESAAFPTLSRQSRRGRPGEARGVARQCALLRAGSGETGRTPQDRIAPASPAAARADAYKGHKRQLLVKLMRGTITGLSNARQQYRARCAGSGPSG